MDVTVLFVLSLRVSEVFKELPQPLRDILMHLSFSLTSLSLSSGGCGFVLPSEQKSWGWLLSSSHSCIHSSACTHV